MSEAHQRLSAKASEASNGNGYETVAQWGDLAVKLVKKLSPQGYPSYSVEKHYRKNRQLKTTGFLRSVSELEELMDALEQAIEEEYRGVIAKEGDIEPQPEGGAE